MWNSLLTVIYLKDFESIILCFLVFVVAPDISFVNDTVLPLPFRFSFYLRYFVVTISSQGYHKSFLLMYMFYNITVMCLDMDLLLLFFTSLL